MSNNLLTNFVLELRERSTHNVIERAEWTGGASNPCTRNRTPLLSLTKLPAPFGCVHRLAGGDTPAKQLLPGLQVEFDRREGWAIREDVSLLPVQARRVSCPLPQAEQRGKHVQHD